jgi:SAM-dependent methyltransferase
MEICREMDELHTGSSSEIGVIPPGRLATYPQELTLDDFARLFGISVNEMPDDCRTLIAQGDFRYRKLESEERDQAPLEVLKRIDSGQFSVAGREGKTRWETGWSENFKSFMEHGHDLAQLVPKYIRPHQPLRLDQGYIVPSDPAFESQWYEVFRLWLFKTYVQDMETVYEFGCGSGFNLAALAQLYPEKRFYGLDWATASKDIVNELARTFGWNMTGLLFDFFAPDENVKIADNSAVLTIGALEQTGKDYEAFLQYLLQGRPSLCINIEPIVELYDENNLVDYAAIRFHRMRNYWEGFPNRLKELERAGRVEILKMKRSYFGSLFLEGYSQTIWRPTGKA